MTIYIDTDYKCHVSTAEGLTAVETDAFDGKCPAYIEGYRYVPSGSTWTREDGVEFQGEMISPWKPWNELDVTSLTGSYYIYAGVNTQGSAWSYQRVNTITVLEGK